MAIIALLALTPMAINSIANRYTKGQILKTVINENMKDAGVPHTILLVNSSTLSGIQIPSEVDGVQVKVITQTQLSSQESGIDTVDAIRLDDVTLGPFGFVQVTFDTGYNSYWPGYNSYCLVILIGCYSFWRVWNWQSSTLV